MYPITLEASGSGFVMPHGPYGSGNEQFLEFNTDVTRFRLQRLGMYLSSDLFSAGYMTASGSVACKALATMARGKKIFFTGELLDQWDLDLLIHCAMRTSLAPDKSRQVKLNPAEFLKAQGLRNDARNRDRVFASLTRLHTGSIEIAGGGYTYMTRLMNRVLVDRDRRFCLLEANADLVASLRREARTALDAHDRMGLGRNGLAKWLHGLLMVFRGGFSANLACLRRLCGLAETTEHAFVQRMDAALALLAGSGLVESWTINQGMVRVTAYPAEPSQAVCGYICDAAGA